MTTDTECAMCGGTGHSAANCPWRRDRVTQYAGRPQQFWIWASYWLVWYWWLA